jgi:hypothetical protein
VSSLSTFALAGSALGVAVTAALAAVFIRDPVKGMVHTTHHPDQLPQVMTGRYIALTLLALGATLYANMAVIAFLFAVFAFLGFADATIYSRAGRPALKHFVAGFTALAVMALALAAHYQTGAPI